MGNLKQYSLTFQCEMNIFLLLTTKFAILTSDEKRFGKTGAYPVIEFLKPISFRKIRRKDIVECESLADIAYMPCNIT